MAKTKKQLQVKYSLLNDKTPFAVKEAYGMLRTNIMYIPTKDGSNTRVIAVTSAEEGTGKSTTIANLALSFARSAKRVVLIDADMRKSVMLRKSIRASEVMGLSEVLSGMVQAQDVIFHTQEANFDVMFAGHFPPNPVELIGNGAFSEIPR